MVRSAPLGQAQAQAQQAPPEGPWRPCAPSPLVMVMVMVMVVVTAMVTAVVLSAAKVVVEEEEEVGLGEVSFLKKESGSGNDVAVMSPLCRQTRGDLLWLPFTADA